MFRYILKRVGLMFLTFAIIMTMSFVLIKLVPDNVKCEAGSKACASIMAWREALGYNRPIIVQYGLYLKHFFSGDFGIGFNMYKAQSVWEIFTSKLPYTVYINVWSSLISIPIGLGLGILAALYKNKWPDQVISLVVMLVISVPSFVYCFIIQYLLCTRWGIFSITVKELKDGLTWFSPELFASYVPSIICMSLGSIAGFTRYTRAELTEVLTSEFMLLARAKGLSRREATVRHAMRNAMVPIFPMILGEFISVLSGSLIIEQFFNIPGVGKLYLMAINSIDMNFFMFLSLFYVVIGLVASLIIDLSYGWVDPRIRMGAR